MAKKSKTRLVRIEATSVDKVCKEKDRTGTPIGRLIKDAIDEKYPDKRSTQKEQ
jgi:hypothetical protein